MSEVCSRRSTTVVPTQAFALMNSEFMNREAKRFAERVIEFAGPDPAKEVDQAFLLALGRLPSGQERDKAQRLLGSAPARDGLARLGVVLFNLNEFIYLE